MIASGNKQGRVGIDITLPRPQAGRRLVAEDLPDTGSRLLPVPVPTRRTGSRTDYRLR